MRYIRLKIIESEVMELESTLNKPVKKEKLKELDYVRAIACIAVVLVHISATGVTEYLPGSYQQIIITLFNRFLKFTTPVFIFLSGITGFYSYKNKELKYFEFIKKRLPRVLIPYFLWCALYYVTYIKLGYYGFDIKFLIKSVISGNMSYHLYFVVIIVQLYLLAPLFYNVIKKSNKRILVLFASAIITLLCAQYFEFKFADRIFLKYMFFYMMGIYVTLEYDKFKSWTKKHGWQITAVYVAIGILYTATYYYNMKISTAIWFLFSAVAVFFVYNVGVFLTEKVPKVYGAIKLMSQGSYYIYLMHPLILSLITIYTAKMGVTSITLRLIIYASVVIPVSVLVSLTYVVVKNKIKDKKNKKMLSNN